MKRDVKRHGCPGSNRKVACNVNRLLASACWIVTAWATSAGGSLFAQTGWQPPAAGCAYQQQRQDGIHPAVVRVVTPLSDGTSYGSGTLVGHTQQLGLVVTNWHVVRGATGTIMVLFPDGFHSAARILKTDQEWDLAALAIWRPNVQPVPVAAYTPQRGEFLTIAGYGSGWYQASTGRVTQYVAPNVNSPFEMVEVSTSARDGDSGGPILNNRGELAGVLFGTAGGRTSGSYCGRVRTFLMTVLDDFQRLDNGPPAMYARNTGPACANPCPRPCPTAPVVAVSNVTPTGARAAEAAPMVALKRPRPAPEQVVAFTPAPSAPAVESVETPASDHTTVTASIAAPDPAASAAVGSWLQLAGATPGEQFKTGLAGVGAVFLLWKVLRLFARSEIRNRTRRRRARA